MVEAINPTMESATQKMKEGASEFSEAVASTTGETFDQYCHQTQDMIAENPFKSVMIAWTM